MKHLEKLSRREVVARGGAALAGWALLHSPLFPQAMLGHPGEEVIPFLDQPPSRPGRILLDWEKLDSWITPLEQFFFVGHYNKPEINEQDWKLDITGLVRNPQSYRLNDLKSLPKREVVFTLECSGNHGFPNFQGGIGNAKWGGTPLAPILEKAGVLDKGIEVVFYGSDEGEEEIRGNKVKQNFARSMSLEDAMNPNNLLCFEMNGNPLNQNHGFPLRLIAPGWFGIANVKWLKRIQVINTRFAGRFMGRDYVTLRQEMINGEPVWTERSVGRYLLKSVTAKVARKDGRYRIYGAAWGAPISRVEVRIDGGSWQRASINEGRDAEFAWKFWHLEWNNPTAGEHTIVSRAVDTAGNVQPAMNDPWIATKKTYWESNGQRTRKIRIS